MFLLVIHRDVHLHSAKPNGFDISARTYVNRRIWLKVYNRTQTFTYDECSLWIYAAQACLSPSKGLLLAISAFGSAKVKQIMS